MPKKPREIVQAYLALGSNLGDRQAHLQSAIKELEQIGPVQAASRMHETAPLGPPQPHYLNACVKIATFLAPEELLSALLDIERAHGRVRNERWGPRTLDLDLLLYGDVQMHSETLTLPHPALHQRAFVLQPLSEIAAQVVVPGLGKTVATLLAELEHA